MSRPGIELRLVQPVPKACQKVINAVIDDDGEASVLHLGQPVAAEAANGPQLPFGEVPASTSDWARTEAA